MDVEYTEQQAIPVATRWIYSYILIYYGERFYNDVCKNVKRMYSFHVSISATWNVSDKTLILVGRSLYTIKLMRTHSQRANSINFSSIRLIQSGLISTSLETLDAFWYYKQLHQTSFRTYSHKRCLKDLNFYHQKHCFFSFYLILYRYKDTRIIFGKNFF